MSDTFDRDYTVIRNISGDVYRYYTDAPSLTVSDELDMTPVWEDVFSDIEDGDERALAQRLGYALGTEQAVRDAIQALKDEGWETPTQAKRVRFERDLNERQKIAAQEEASDLQEELDAKNESKAPSSTPKYPITVGSTPIHSGRVYEPNVFVSTYVGGGVSPNTIVSSSIRNIQNQSGM